MKNTTYDISFYTPIVDNNCYNFVNYSTNEKLTNINNRRLYAIGDNNYSAYHQLFIGNHSVCKIENTHIKSNRRLLLNCDSMSVPFIPFISLFFDSILALDNRTKETYSNIVNNFKATDYICMLIVKNYLNGKILSNVK